MRSLFVLLVLVAITTSFAHAQVRCHSANDCCADADCVVPRGSRDNVTYCVMPNDAFCPRCDLGWHYNERVCTPDMFPCQVHPNPCAAQPETVCVYDPKRCIRSPCPQWRCAKPDELCPFGFEFNETFSACVRVADQCRDAADCCESASCIPMRGHADGPKFCVMPNDGICPPCKSGYYVDGKCPGEEDVEPTFEDELPSLTFSAPLITYCMADDDCCSGARCMAQVGDKRRVCVIQESGNFCPSCGMGFHYVEGRCTPTEFPCVTNPCPSATVCKYSPKRCIRAPCPQYDCVDPASACPRGQKLDARTGVCVDIRAEMVDDTDCVICPQIMPDCGDKCRVGLEKCVVFPQTCDRCAYAKCTRLR